MKFKISTPSWFSIIIYSTGTISTRRYMIDRTGHLKSAFRNVDTRIVGLLSNRMVPPTLLTFYRKLTDILAKQAQVKIVWQK